MPAGWRTVTVYPPQPAASPARAPLDYRALLCPACALKLRLYFDGSVFERTEGEQAINQNLNGTGKILK